MLSPSNPGWNHKIEPFALPPLTRIILADVDAGSDTPSLVGRVLKWRQEHVHEGGSGACVRVDPLLVFFSLECVSYNLPFCSRPIRNSGVDSGPPMGRAAKCKCRGGIARKAPARSLWGGARSVCRRRSDRSEYLGETCAFFFFLWCFLMPDLAGVLLIPTRQWSSDSSEVVKLLGSLHAATEVCVICDRHTAFSSILNGIAFGPPREYARA